MEIKNAKINFQANTGNTEGEVKKIKDSVNGLYNDIQKKKAALESSTRKKKLDEILGIDPSPQGGIKGLKSMFGEESALGNIGKIAVGAGAVAAIAAMVRLTKQLSDSVVDFRNAWNESTDATYAVVDNFARAVPILGDIYSTGQNIRELITGELADAKELQRVEEQRRKDLEGTLAIKKLIKDFDKSLRADVSDTQAQIQMTRETGTDKAISQINLESQQKQREIDKNREEQLKKVAELSKGLAAGEAVAQAKKQIDEEHRVRTALNGQLTVARIQEEEQNELRDRIKKWQEDDAKAIKAEADAKKKAMDDEARHNAEMRKKQMDAMEEYKRQTRSLVESVEEPIDKYGRMYRDILERFQSGAIDAGTFDKLKEKYGKEFAEASKVQAPSSEIRRTAGIVTGQGSSTDAKALLDENKKQTAILDAQRELLAKLQTVIAI